MISYYSTTLLCKNIWIWKMKISHFKMNWYEINCERNWLWYFAMKLFLRLCLTRRIPNLKFGRQPETFIKIQFYNKIIDLKNLNWAEISESLQIPIVYKYNETHHHWWVESLTGSQHNLTSNEYQWWRIYLSRHRIYHWLWEDVYPPYSQI